MTLTQNYKFTKLAIYIHDYWLIMIIGCKIWLTVRTLSIALKPH